MNTPLLYPLALSIALLVLSACGDSSDTNTTLTDTTPSTAQDTGLPDAETDAETDAERDTEPSANCVDIAPMDTNFELAPDSPNTQIHAAASFSGDAIHLAFNLREQVPGSSNFDVYALSLRCDGTLIKDPFRVTTTRSTNRIDPSIATGPTHTIISWQSDNGNAPDNLDIFFRLFDNTLTPSLDEETLLVASRNDTPNLSNAWMTQTAALSDGSFALVGAWGHDEAPGFQTFLQRIQANGALDGDAIDMLLDANAFQTHPTIAAGPNGALYVAWTQSDENDNETVQHTRLLPASTTPSTSVPATQTAASLASYSVHPTTGTSWIAMSILNGDASNVDILVKRGDDFSGSSNDALIVGENNENEHTPTVAAGAEDGGAVAWFRTQSGFRNSLFVSRFLSDLSLARTIEVPITSPAAPYAPVLLHIQDHVYFVAWSQGTSPDFRLYGRFIDLQ